MAIRGAPDVAAVSLVDSLHAALQNRILTGEIAPGEPMTEVSIATAYSVARPTAKAAMERLVQDGLLRRSTNKTARVPVLGPEDIRDVYLSRQLVERAVVTTLSQKRLVPDESRRLLAALDDVAGQDPAMTTVVDIDIDFHRSLVDALNSPRLSRIYNGLIGETHLCMAQAFGILHPTGVAAEHAAILNAIEAGDTARAVSEMTGHLERACMRLISHFNERQRTAPPVARSLAP